MAQYDGSIRINTKIDTKGFKDGEKEIESESRRMAESVSKTADEIEKELANLKNAQKSFLDAGGKKTSPVYQQYEKEISELQNALQSLKNTQDDTEIADEHWNLLRMDVEEYAKSLKELHDQGKFFGDEEYDRIYLAWKNATDAVKAYQAELNKQTESGQAKIAEKEAKAAEKKEAAQRRAEEQAERALQKENARIQKEIENQAKLEAREAERKAKEEARIAAIQAKEEAKRAKEVASIQEQETEEQRLAEIRENAVVGNQRIVEVMERRKQLLREMKDMKAAGIGPGYQQFDSAQQELASLNQEIKDYANSTAEMKESYVRLGASVKQAFLSMGRGLVNIPIATVKAGVRGLSSAFQKLGGIVKKVATGSFQFLGNVAKNVFSKITKSSKQSAGVMSSFGSRLKSLALSALIFNQISKAFNAMISGIKQGFGNMYKEVDGFKSAVDGLKASSLTLKNAFAAAFRPLVEIAIPYIQKAIEYITRLADSFGQLMAAITGQKTYTKAIKQTTAALEDAKEAEEGYLSPLDEINKFQKKESQSGSGGSAGTMFEEVPISDKFKDISSWLKRMWENADFTKLGTVLGQKLKSALDGIDWEPIKKVAEKIGKSIGTLINGFVEVKGLGETIGKTIGEAINTGIGGVNAFLDNTRWDSVGKFIGDGLNGLVNTINWEGLGHQFAQKWNAVFATIGEAARTFDWKNFGLKLSNGINTAISDFDWAENGARLGNLVKGILDTLITLLENTNWQELGNNVADFIGSIDWTGIMERIAEGIGAALGGLAAFLWGLIEDAWGKVVDWWYDVAFEDGVFTITGLLNGILEAVKNIGSWIVEHIFQPFIDGFKKAFGIHSPSTVMAEMGTYLMEGLFNGISSLVDSVISIFIDIKEKISGKWEEIKQGTSEIWNSIKENLSSTWSNIKDFASESFENIRARIADKWNLTKATTSNAWSGIKSYLSNAWTGIKNTASSGASYVKNGVMNAWNSLRSGTTNIWNAIRNAIKTPINAILGFIDRMVNGIINGVNGMIGALNSLHFSIPDWVPGLGGKSFGFNLGYLGNISIPRLATGTVVPPNREFMAVLGDNKREPEVVSPISTMKQAVLEAIAEAGGIGEKEITIKVPVYIGDKQVYEATVRYGKTQQMSTGKNPFALGTT